MASEATARSASPIVESPVKRKVGLVRQLRTRAFARIGWGLADQAVSSLTNVAVSFYLVHTLTKADFGAFSVAYITYGFALNASRGLATDPLMVRYSGVEVKRWRRAVACATGTATAVGLLSGSLSISVGIIVGGVTGTAFLALGLTLPGLMLQDSWRFSFFALGRGSQAFLNDCIWAVALVPAILILRLTGHATVFWVLLAWGASAGIGAVAGAFQARVRPRLVQTWLWVYLQRDLGPRYLAEGTVSNSGYLFRGYGTGLMLGLAALGTLQASVTLFGPTTILFAAMGLVTIPEAARVVRRAPSKLGLFCLVASGGLATLGLIWGVVVLVALPRGLGGIILGPIWRPTYPLVLPTVISIVGSAVGTGPGAVLHALGASRKSLRVVILSTVLFTGFSLGGAALLGAAGVCWGTALSSWMTTVVSWWQMLVATREAGIPQSMGVSGLLRKFIPRRTLTREADPQAKRQHKPIKDTAPRHARR
jgi:O-antigen/teichoic acid export membrane protein